MIGLVMHRSVVQLGIGRALALALAWLVSGALQPVLDHVDPHDAAVFAAVVAALGVGFFLDR